MHNETLSVAAMRVSNPDCSSAKKQCNKLQGAKIKRGP
jgi:hypothetical protein